MPRLLLALLACLFVSLPAFAAEPISKFEPDGTKGVSADFQRWHSEFEDVGDYGESWFFVSRCEDGSTLFTMLSITNLGLSTFAASVDLQFYAMDGRKWNLHHEYDRDDITAATDRMDITVGPAHVWGGGDAYHVTINESDVQLDFHLNNELPSYKFGSGKVLFYEDQSAEYTLGISAPRARASGTITLGGEPRADFGADFDGESEREQSSLSRAAVPDEAAYLCDSCGESIVIPIDASAGRRQEYVEDCPVCCNANVIRVDLGEDGQAWASANGE